MPVTRGPPGFDASPATQVQTSAVNLDAGFTERRFQLSVLSGPETGRSVEVNKPEFRVGKGEDCDLVLNDPTVSRLHFVIEQQEGAYVIRDTASTNGTWIDQFRIREAYLRPGVVVRAGQVQVKLESLFKPLEIAPSHEDKFGPLVGRSVRMRQIFTMLERVAKTDATVVIFGETGTGKSAIAQAIHEASARKKGPFITVDCGAIAENLIESELFGHEKGSFTGASALRRGALERAHGGTLFIDELVDLRLDLQPRLLRVLEEREVQRVGGNDTIKLDFRIIAASRFDLWREVEAKRFREDLYFRLAVFTLPLPSLRERREDIPLLARAFARSLKGGDQLLRSLTPEVLERLSGHPFPGNVRELRNVIERALYLESDPNELVGPSVMREAPPTPIAPQVAAPGSHPPRTERAVHDPTSETIGVVADCSLPFKDAKEKLLEQFETEYFRRILERASGNASAAARLAGIDRKHVYTMARKYGLDLKARGRDGTDEE